MPRRVNDVPMNSNTLAYLKLFAARCLSLVGAASITIIAARMLGTSGQGRYYYIVTLASISAQFASLGIHSSNTYLVAKDHSLLPRILTNTAWIAIVGGCVAAYVAISLDGKLDSESRLQAPALFVLVLCPLNLLFLYLSNLAIAINRPDLFNGLIIFNTAASLGATAAAAFISPTVLFLIGALVLSSFTTCCVSWVLIARDCDTPWRFDVTLFRQSISFASRSYIATLAAFFMSRTSIIVLRHYGAFDDVGRWSIAAQICDALLLLPASVSLLLFPSFVRADVTGRWSELKSATIRVGTVMAMLCILIGVVSGPLIELIFGAPYASSQKIVITLLPGVFFLSLSATISQFLSAFGIPLLQIAAWVIGFCVQVGLSLQAFSSYGVVGLAGVQSGCAAFVCAWLLLLTLAYAPPSPPTCRTGPAK